MSALSWLRCKWHARADFGWLIRCQLPRGHGGDHRARSGMSELTWPRGANER